MTAVEQSYTGATSRLLLLGGAMFVVGTNAFVIAGLLPELAASFEVPPSQVSLAISFYSLVVAVGAPMVSLLLPRVPRGILMASGMAVFTLGAAIAAIADTAVVFDLGRVLSGIGGAALVPTATASAASLVPPDRRGRALGVVLLGFTLATAVGAPLGTALGGIAGWRTPLWIVVAMGGLVAIAIALRVRAVPLAPAVGLRRRLAPLRNPRVLAVLLATFLVIAGFNVVYIFSSSLTAGATGGDPTLLAVLLLSYGVAGVAGNAVAGSLTDRLGNRAIGFTAIGGQALVLLALPLVSASLVGTGILFAVWGVVAFAAAVPLQHRLVGIDPATSTLALSWYSTAMYLGIAIAPVLGGIAVRIDAQAVAVIGAGASALAALVFGLGFATRRGAVGEVRDRRSRGRVARPDGG